MPTEQRLYTAEDFGVIGTAYPYEPLNIGLLSEYYLYIVLGYTVIAFIVTFFIRSKFPHRYSVGFILNIFFPAVSHFYVKSKYNWLVYLIIVSIERSASKVNKTSNIEETIYIFISVIFISYTILLYRIYKNNKKLGVQSKLIIDYRKLSKKIRLYMFGTLFWFLAVLSFLIIFDFDGFENYFYYLDDFLHLFFIMILPPILLVSGYELYKIFVLQDNSKQFSDNFQTKSKKIKLKENRDNCSTAEELYNSSGFEMHCDSDKNHEYKYKSNLDIKDMPMKNEIKIPRISTKQSPREILAFHFKSVGELPISGGWGYTIDDAVIIDKNDSIVPKGIPFNGYSVENIFVEKRIYEELIIFRNEDDRYSGIKWKQKHQSLHTKDGRKYDKLIYEVSALPDKVWNELKARWEGANGYKSSNFDKDAHMKMHDEQTIRYVAEYWFDITSFFGLSAEEDI